jgi:hypothetical protein
MEDEQDLEVFKRILEVGGILASLRAGFYLPGSFDVANSVKNTTDLVDSDTPTFFISFLEDFKVVFYRSSTGVHLRP